MTHPGHVNARDKISSGPPGGEEEADPFKLVGVPEGFVAKREIPTPRDEPLSVRFGDPSSTTLVSVAPQYNESHVWAPAGLAVETQAALQLSMLQAGVFKDTEEFLYGHWDPTTRKAYRRVLEFANAAGMDFEEAISRWSELQQEGGGLVGARGKAKDRAPLTVELPNPMDVANRMGDTARQSIGKLLEQPEIQQYVTDYQQKVAAYQQQAHAAAETGGTVTAPPSVEAYTEQRLRQDKPHEVFETNMIDVFNTLAEMIGTVSKDVEL